MLSQYFQVESQSTELTQKLLLLLPFSQVRQQIFLKVKAGSQHLNIPRTYSDDLRSPKNKVKYSSLN